MASGELDKFSEREKTLKEFRGPRYLRGLTKIY
jgi:hypothetical protein